MTVIFIGEAISRLEKNWRRLLFPLNRQTLRSCHKPTTSVGYLETRSSICDNPAKISELEKSTRETRAVLFYLPTLCKAYTFNTLIQLQRDISIILSCRNSYDHYFGKKSQNSRKGKENLKGSVLQPQRVLSRCFGAVVC